MATRAALKRLATKWHEKRTFPYTPKLHKKSKAKPVSNFYGQPIKKGGLHKDLGIKQGEKIPVSLLASKIARLKKKKNKTVEEVKKERELVYAQNAKKWK